MHTGVSGTMGKADPKGMLLGIGAQVPVKAWHVDLASLNRTRGAGLCAPQSRNFKININNHILYLFCLVNTF